MLTTAVIFYNEEKNIRSCVDSLLLNIEYIDKVIFCDNGSTDGSLKICEEIVKNYPDKFSIIHHAVNKGQDYNWYYLSRYPIDTEYLMLIRPRDKVPKDYVKTMIEALDANPTASACYPNFYARTKGGCSGNDFFAYMEVNGTDHPDAFTRIVNYNKYFKFRSSMIMWGVLRTKAYQNALLDIDYKEKNGKIVTLNKFDDIFNIRFLVQGPFCKAETYLYEITDRPPEATVVRFYRYWKAFAFNPFVNNIRLSYEDNKQVISRLPNKPDNWEEQYRAVYIRTLSNDWETCFGFVKSVLVYWLLKCLGVKTP